MSVCPSAWNNLSPTGWIFMKFDIRIFFENLSWKFKVNSNLTRKLGNLHEVNCTFMIITHPILLSMRNVSEKSCRENKKNYDEFPPPQTMPLMGWCGKILWSRTGHSRQLGRHSLHAAYLQLQTHAQNMETNTYCFSTATMVTQIHSVLCLYIHCLLVILRCFSKATYP